MACQTGVQSRRLEVAVVRHYNFSEIEHPLGMLLTGPARRGAVSRWSGVETTYESGRVYLFVGNGDPRLLGARSGSEKPQFDYEVRPEGELRLDMKGGLWDSVSCESALIVALIERESFEAWVQSQYRSSAG